MFGSGFLLIRLPTQFFSDMETDTWDFLVVSDKVIGSPSLGDGLRKSHCLAIKGLDLYEIDDWRNESPSRPIMVRFVVLPIKHKEPQDQGGCT